MTPSSKADRQAARDLAAVRPALDPTSLASFAACLAPET